jgi:signal transduction histidine kinase
MNYAAEPLPDESLPPKERAVKLNRLARSLTYIDPIKALAYSNEALQLATQENMPLEMADAYRNLSSVYSYNESYYISMEYLQRALDLFTAQGDSTGIANCYISLGHTYRRLRNRPEEVRYHRKAYDMFKRLGPAERRAVTAHNLGESYFLTGNLAQSRQLTREAMPLLDSLNIQPVLSACYKVLGWIAQAEHQNDSAEYFFKRALGISTELGAMSQKVATIEAIIALAELARQKGDAAAELHYLQQGAAFSTAYQLTNHLQVIYNQLVLLSSRQNDQASVRKYIEAYISLADSLTQRQMRDRSSLTQSVIQVHELSRTTRALEQENTAQQSQLQRRTITIIIVSLFALVLAWLALMLVRGNKKLREQRDVIEVQKKNLAELNDTKDKFFAIVAHDLKSPLNSLHSFSSLLLAHFDSLTKEEILTMGAQLKESVDNTIKMADNLIVWARQQMREVEYHETVLDATEIFENIRTVYQPVAEKKQVRLQITAPPALPLRADRDQVEFMVRNLVNNAIKFTSAGGVVTVTGRQREQHVEIIVTDTGTGMSQTQLQHLFTVGRKKSRPGTAGEKGTGLGLLLCKEFVTLNGGNLEVDSEEGKGSRFTITLRAA